MRSICVFAGSAPGARTDYRDAIATLGSMLAARGIHMVYGGGSIGGMATLFESVNRAGGTATGVIPQSLVDLEVAETRLGDLRVVGSMHERKALMAESADAFIAAPGGLGTLEEFTEVATWSQLGLHHKPTGLLNTAGYYTRLLDFLDNTTTEGFLHPAHRANILAADEPDKLLDALQNWHPVDPGRWWETRPHT